MGTKGKKRKKEKTVINLWHSESTWIEFVIISDPLAFLLALVYNHNFIKKQNIQVLKIWTIYTMEKERKNVCFSFLENFVFTW